MPNVAETREWWTRTGHRQRLTRAIVPRIATLRGTVLDVGGGREAAHDVAWDPSVRRIRLDLMTTHHPDLCGDALALPFADGTVDGVAMFEVLEHVADPARAVREVHRALRPGGTFLGSAPFIWPIHGDPHDYFRFAADGLRSLLEMFSEAELTPMGNAPGAAWILLTSRSRTARVFNPLFRGLGARPDPGCPEGYVFSAQK